MSFEHHAYGDKRSQFGELYLPDRFHSRHPPPPPFPVAVVIHGGFWKAQYSRKLMHPLCRDLAARG